VHIRKAWNCCQDVRPGETMKGTPDNTVILHWDECQTAWAELPWRDWVRFRGFGEGGASLLAGAEAGEHYFLVCVLEMQANSPTSFRTDTSYQPTAGSFTDSMDSERQSVKNITGFRGSSYPRLRTQSAAMNSVHAGLPSTYPRFIRCSPC